MINKKHKTRLALLVSGVLLLLAVKLLIFDALERRYFSEKPLTPQILSPSNATTNLELISLDNIKSIDGLVLLSNPNNKTKKVVAFAEMSGSNLIQGIYENGTYARWDMDSREIVMLQSVFDNKESNVPIYNISAGISFNRDGKYLISPNGVYSNILYGKRVWDLSAMDILEEIHDTNYRGLSLHPTLDLEFQAGVDYVGDSYGFLSKHGGGGIDILKDQYGTADFIRLGMDPSGDFLAVADENGAILVGDISSSREFDLGDGIFAHATTYKLDNFFGQKETTIDLKFDSTHSWLAKLTNKTLVVWSLNNFVFPVQLRVKIESGNAMSFDRTGQILAVATQKGITLFDVKNKTTIAEYPVGEVTALYFSRDNRLLIWGDAEGKVHLWGVPK